MEIRFRAWDKVYGHFHEGDIVREYCLGDFVDNPEYVVTQYTGQKDKYDMEIYEGDIVKYTERNLDNVFGGKGEPWVEKIKVVKWFNHGWMLPKGFVKDIKIIGNIFENPELLEDK